MKSGHVALCAMVCVFISGCTEKESTMKPDLVPSAGHYSRGFEKTVVLNLNCKYLLFLPEGYGKEEQKWPLMLFLHGAGERGENLELVKKHGPPKIVGRRKDFPFVVVSPQCPAEQWWTEKNEVLISLLDEIQSSYNVDSERTYLTGLSMGGYGTWALASAYPERFAAIAPICGGGKPFLARRLKDVPTWAFHGAKDNVVPLKESEQMVGSIKRSGGDARLTVYPDAGHDSWTAAYNNEELYDWFLSHRKTQKK